MAMKIKEWILTNSGIIQAIATVVQTVIAALMLWTLIQSAEGLSVTRRQLESSIEPVLDMTMFGSKLRLTNTGSVDIVKLNVIGGIGAHFDTTTQKLSDYQVSHAVVSLFNVIKVGETIEIDLSQYLTPTAYPKPPEAIDVYCLALQYRRSADMKPFTRFVPFTVGKDWETQKINIFIPLFPSAFSSESKKIPGNDTIDNARQELIRLYKTKVMSEDF